MDICFDDNKLAKRLVDNGTFALVVVSGQKSKTPASEYVLERTAEKSADNQEVLDNLYTFTDSGVRRLITLLEDGFQILKDSFVCDKIVGKAAAALLVLGGAKAVYAKVISEVGLSFLLTNGITVEYGERVQRIINRTGDGFCPIEEASLPAITAAEAYDLIKARLKELAKK